VGDARDEHGVVHGAASDGTGDVAAGGRFITFAEEGIATVTGYFDSGKLPRDLGLD